MFKKLKTIFLGLLLALSIYSHQNDISILDWIRETRESNRNKNKEYLRKIQKRDNQRSTKDYRTKINDNSNSSIEYYPQPKNGFSPYNQFFGKGIYNNNSGNVFIIKNSNSSDAVVLLVNAYTGKKIRNEYIRKGATFEMTSVPNGTYYLEWASGNNWNPNLRVGSLKGGFQTDASFTKTKDSNDWMRVDGYQQWTVTLYNVSGGDVQSEKLAPNEFGN